MDNGLFELCPICWDVYNRSTKKRVSCIHCGKSACKKCTEENLLQKLTSQYSQPNCSNPDCGKLWNNDFLRCNLTQKFYKELEELREEDAFANEEANIFPQFQEFAKKYSKKKEKYGNFDQINEEIKRIDRVLAPMQSRREKLVQINLEMKNLRNGKDPYYFRDPKAPQNEKSKDVTGIKVCPKEDCRGYLDKNYVCGMCNIEACKKCCCIKEENHRCDPDQIKTVNEIKKISKACPTCGIFTEKIIGCPDMWCVNCKKGWNWDTEEVMEGRIVNPEYFDWINRNIDHVTVREDGDTPCGGLPDYHIVRRGYGSNITDAYRKIAHINDYERGTWVEKVTNIDCYYVGYLAREVSRKELIKKRAMVKNMERRNREVLSILDTFLACCIDIFRYLVHKPSRIKGEKGYKDLEKLRIRTNIALRDLGRKYKMSTPTIEEFE
uniref:E3 ubiquitin-protein ligase n=1 Tax=Marseillevirus LCMAC101 TaxID=2506602 RepID=A0A481YQT9_9VIRU|nr:MAG: E3 ubiquitin-protein ligase [Marseillevirus LCMAC101]